MLIMTSEETIEYFNNRKKDAEKALKEIKESDEEAKRLGINFKEQSQVLIDYYTSEIELCDRNLAKLQK